MEQQNDLKEWGKKMAAIGVVGVLLVGGLSAVIFGPPVDKEVKAGALQTTERNCEFVELEGQTYFRCGDGFEGKVMMLDPTPLPEQNQ